MIDKIRVPLMVCTSAASDKVPLDILGGYSNPICLFQGANPPLQ